MLVILISLQVTPKINQLTNGAKMYLNSQSRSSNFSGEILVILIITSTDSHAISFFHKVVAIAITTSEIKFVTSTGGWVVPPSGQKCAAMTADRRQFTYYLSVQLICNNTNTNTLLQISVREYKLLKVLVCQEAFFKILFIFEKKI